MAEDRFDALAPWVVGLLLALPVALVRSPPMADLPDHEAVVGVLRHLGDAAFFPPGLYRLNLGHPNQAFYLLAWALSFVTSVPTACKLVSAATIAAMPVCAARLARHLGRPAWVGALAAPVMLGWLFFWGVVANMLGMVVLIAALPALDRWCAAPSRAGAVKTFGVFVLLYFAHEQMLAVGCGFVLLMAVLRPIDKSSAYLVAPVLALVVATVVQMALQQDPLMTPDQLAQATDFAGPLHKLKIMPGMLFPGQTPLVRAAACGVIATPLVWLAIERARRGGQGPGGREKLVAYRFEIFAALLLVGYFVFPNDAHGAHLLYHRFWPVAFVVLVVLAAPTARPGWRPSPVLRWLTCIVPICSLVVAGPSLLMSDRLYRDYDSLLEHVERGSAVMNFELTPATDLVRGIDLQGRVVALKGGRCSFDYTRSPIAPVIMAPELRWNESTHRLHGYGGFRPGVDLLRYRYLFLRAREPGGIYAFSVALEPEARLVDQKGEWGLFESRFPVVPITAPEEPGPAAEAGSLLERMRPKKAKP